MTAKRLVQTLDTCDDDPFKRHLLDSIIFPLGSLTTKFIRYRIFPWTETKV